jgi:hypothetical protein
LSNTILTAASCELGCPRRVSSSCSTSGTLLLLLLKTRWCVVKMRLWQNCVYDKRTYPWSFVPQIFQNVDLNIKLTFSYICLWNTQKLIETTINIFYKLIYCAEHENHANDKTLAENPTTELSLFMGIISLGTRKHKIYLSCKLCMAE